MFLKKSFFYLIKGFGGLSILRALKKDKITILCFHRVSDEYSPAWKPLDISTFLQILKYINKHYSVLTLQEAVNVKTLSKPGLVISFDDGYRDFYINALPLLVKYKFPAIMSVVVESIESENKIWTQQLNKIIEAYLDSNKELIINATSFLINSKNIQNVSIKIFLELLDLTVSERNNILQTLESKAPKPIEHTQMMNWNELADCMKYNIEIASHSYSHLNLAKTDSIETLKREIFFSRDILSQKLNYSPETIAFPNGQYTQQTVDLSVQAGFKYLLLIDEELYKPKMNIVQNDYFCLPRLLIQYNSFIENCFKIENFHNIIKKQIKH
ncbi:MAG: polysaccharide deacetylase family protein [Bacteroidales bacterium]|nr:polysaccharide deacetylase family protein [Bacteroidales bacterium]